MTPFASKRGFGILAIVLLVGVFIAAAEGSVAVWVFAAGCAYCTYMFVSWDSRE